MAPEQQGRARTVGFSYPLALTMPKACSRHRQRRQMPRAAIIWEQAGEPGLPPPHCYSLGCREGRQTEPQGTSACCPCAQSSRRCGHSKQGQASSAGAGQESWEDGCRIASAVLTPSN